MTYCEKLGSDGAHLAETQVQQRGRVIQSPPPQHSKRLKFSNDDSFFQSKWYIVWKAMVYDIYLGVTSMEQKNNKVTLKTFEGKVPSYLQQKNNNAMSISKRRTHEWYRKVTYVRDWMSQWAIGICDELLCQSIVEVWESVWVFRIIFQLSHSNSTNDNQPFSIQASVYSTVIVWFWKKPFVEKR